MSEKNISEQLTLNEFQGFIGCLLYLGCQHGSSFSIKKIFSNCDYTPQFRPIQDTMSRKRFSEIISSLRFENIDVTNQMKSKDKGFSVRWMKECFNEISSNTYFSKSYTLDENLHRVKSRCQFLQYIPTKPDCIGLKTHVLASSSIRYVVAMELYTGTRLDDNNIVMPNSGTEVAKRVNFCCDNWYSSLDLLTFLQSMSISFIGTLRSNRKEVDEDMRHSKTRELKSVKTKYIDGTSLTSYKCKLNKTVLILSSIHDKVRIDPKTKKPNCVSVYNSLKGGVDVIDQMIKTLTIRRPVKIWTSAYFLRFMDFILLNSFTTAKELKIINRVNILMLYWSLNSQCRLNQINDTDSAN